jgi:putative tryptophan/tyrosine transport system substrate-binding protein
MSKTKLAVLLLVVSFVFFGLLQSCSATKEAENSPQLVAVATLMSHPALDAVQENMRKELERQGFQDGKNIRYVIKNANGQMSLTANIASELAAQHPAVVVAVTTPMAQAVVKNATSPVVFAAVTDPVGAGVIKQIDLAEPNVTGTSDAWPYEDQLKLIRKISPNAKRLGVLYNPGEAASQYGIREIKKYAPGLGFELVEGAVNSTNEVYPVAQNLVRKVDALFLSSDNTVIGGAAAAVKVAVEHKLPLYVGDSGTVEKGGLAAVSVGYADLGTETGKLVGRVLRGEKNIPTVIARGSEIYINKKAAELMGVTVPEEVLKSATKVYLEVK